MDSAPGGGDGRRRGRKSRGRHGRRKNPSNNNNNNHNRSRGGRGHHQPQHEWYAKESSRDDSSVLGGRTITKPTDGRRPSQEDGGPDAFAMFCACHLGITPDDGFREPRLDEVARRYGMKKDEIIELLKEFQLDDESVRGCKYDMVGAKMDMRLAPEGISRTESARELYVEYVEYVEAMGSGPAEE